MATGDVIRTGPLITPATGDVVRTGALITGTTGDVRTSSASACACCGTAGACPPCPGWPKSSASLTFAGASVTEFCCVGSGLPPYRLNGLADCINREWVLPLSTFGIGNPCVDGFAQTCNVIPDSWPFSSSSPLQIGVGVQISRNRDAVTGEPTTVTVLAGMLILTPRGLGVACASTADYSKTYSWEEFDCAGTWTLDLGTPSDSGGIAIDWPATVDVTLGDDTPASTITDCCTVTWEDCTSEAESFNCVDGVCVDPGDGTGEFGSSADCAFWCGVITDGGGPPGDGTDTGDAITTGCCDTVRKTINLSIFAGLGADPCLEMSSLPLAWSNGFKGWLGSEPGCGTFIRAALYCTTGEVVQWQFRLWIGATLVVDTAVPADLLGDHICSPFRRHFGVDIPGYGHYTIALEEEGPPE